MKKLLLIIMLGLTLSAASQYYNPPKGWASPELYLPASVLVSTFAINQYVPMDLKTRNQIALTGMLTSATTHFILRKIRTNKYKRR